MASKMVRPHGEEKSNRINRWFNARLATVTAGYGRALERMTALRPGKRLAGVVLVMLACVAATWGLARLVPSELAPAEDRGSFFVSIVGPEGAGFDFSVPQVREVERVSARRVAEEARATGRDDSRAAGGWGASEVMHAGTVIVFLVGWVQRSQTTAEV